MDSINLLLVDDEQEQRELLAGYLEKHGFDVTQASDGKQAIECYHRLFSPVALVDMKMPVMTGLELLALLREINPFIQVIVLTAFGSVESAVNAMQAGAFDYLTKPIENLDELKVKLTRAAGQNRLMVDNRVMSDRLAEVFPDTKIDGESPAIQKVKEVIAMVAPRDATVLITGESGTGKELVARAIHALSDRADKKLVTINCAAFPETLLESELFGYERGAFTGADRSRQGRFELADGGTLFLDEVGEMPLPMQVKLLRVLQDHIIQRLGSVKEIKLDLRLIAATNRNLENLIKEGGFREDLYYRLNVINVRMPNLAERGGDILLLAKMFIEKFARKIGRPVGGLEPDASALLTSYSWPGNVRELENVIERAIILAKSSNITGADLGFVNAGVEKPTGIVKTLSELEREAIRDCLLLLDWNLSASAERLGIHRNTLRSKIKEYGLTRP